MMHAFVFRNRNELVKRCGTEMAQRPQRTATFEQLKIVVPLVMAISSRPCGPRAAELNAGVRAQTLGSAVLDSILRVEANHEGMLAALENLLSNAFKFSPQHGEIKVSAQLENDERICNLCTHKKGN